jgi:hypothetical protein
MTTALLIIDVQEILCSGRWAAVDAAGLVQRINPLAHGFAVTLVSDGHTTLDNGVLSAAQISAHHNTTLAHVDSYGPRVRLLPAAEVAF